MRKEEKEIYLQIAQSRWKEPHVAGGDGPKRKKLAHQIMCNLLRLKKIGFPVETHQVLSWYPKCASQHMMNRSTGKSKKSARRQKKMSNISPDKRRI